MILLYRTIKNAVKLLRTSHSINENFLVTISCIGAYLIGEHFEGLMVIVRPGPYICSEWEFGGLLCWIPTDEELVAELKKQEFCAPWVSPFALKQIRKQIRIGII